MSDPQTKKRPEKMKPHVAIGKADYRCTECGGDAFVAYGAGFGGKVKSGERICTRCFVKRGGDRIF